MVANPIPQQFSLDENKINQAIEEAIVEAETQNITGKAATPFLLAKLKDITEGKSLSANLKLVYNNAVLAGKIAKELSKL